MGSGSFGRSPTTAPVAAPWVLTSAPSIHRKKLRLLQPLRTTIAGDSMSRVLEVEFTDTLMRYDADWEIHVESGDRLSTFYFRVPDDWVKGTDEELQGRVL